MPDTVAKQSTDTQSSQSKLGVKLITYVLFFSFFVTLATSGYIIYSDYRQGTNTLNQSISQIQAGYQESISYSLWNFDSQQIKTQLAGIINFPGVLNVYIETKEGLLHSTGDFQQTYSEKHAFDLYFVSADRQYPLGVLNITLDYQGLYKTLFYKALNILITQFIKTFSVSLFILFIFQKLITNRLIKMSDWAKTFSLNNLDNELLIRNKKSSEPDEIDSVVSAINNMRMSLKDDIQKRELTEQALNQSQYKLSIAINNAELGFCEYSHKTDRFVGNQHFAHHLELTPEKLEVQEHPVDWFKSLICGDNSIEQRERINQLLHGHMERICTELSMQCTEDIVKHFDTTIQVSEWDDNGLPVSIVFCILDKTEQVIASKQAAELNFALEQKVTKRTEELSHEQVQSQAEIKKMQHQLSSFEQYRSRQKSQENLIPLQYALKHLSNNLKDNADNQNNEQSEQLVHLLSEHLIECNKLENETFDICSLLKEITVDVFHAHKADDNIQFKLPFSLMLDSYQNIIAYSIRKTSLALLALIGNELSKIELAISLTLEEDTAVIVFNCRDFGNEEILERWQKPDDNAVIIAKMCHSVIEELLEGSVVLTQSDDAGTSITMSFNINVRS